MLERYKSGDTLTFQYCPFTGNKLSNPIDCRVLKVDLAIDENEKTFRNLSIRRTEDRHPLENIPDCENAQWFFNYKDTDKVEKRTMICFGKE